MFGEEANQPTLRVCCGPRCGAEVGHRAIYAAVETAAGTISVAVHPTMCQGFCGLGVTLGLPNGEKIKLRDVPEARAQVENWEDNQRPCHP